MALPWPKANAGIENAALRVFYKWVITIFRLKTARLLFGLGTPVLRSMGKSKKSKLRVSLPNNLLKEIVIVCHGGPLGLKVSQDSTTGHVLIKSFHLLPSGPCHRPFAPSGLSPSTSGSAAPLPWPRYIYTIHTPSHLTDCPATSRPPPAVSPTPSSHSSSSLLCSLRRRTGAGGEEPIVRRGRCAALHQRRVHRGDHLQAAARQN